MDQSRIYPDLLFIFGVLSPTNGCVCITHNTSASHLTGTVTQKSSLYNYFPSVFRWLFAGGKIIVRINKAKTKEMF